MSRSNPTEAGIPSPVQKYLEYHGGRGNMFFYDSEAKKNVEFEKGEFILLDTLNSVTGWHNSKETKISSNLIRNIKTEELRVVALANKNNAKTTEVAEGLWDENFKNKIKAVGGNFTINLFGLLKTKSGWELVRMQLSKSDLQAWSSFTDELKKKESKTAYDGVISITRSKLKTKGSIRYYTPVFELKEIDAETEEMAIEKDKELQKYFTDVKARYGGGGTATDSESNMANDYTAEAEEFEPAPAVVSDDDDDLPF